MANQRLNRLKSLMKDRDFDWPSEEKLKENKLQRDLVNSQTQSAATSLTELTDAPPKAYNFSKPSLHSSSLSLHTPSDTFESEVTMPPKHQNKQGGGQPINKPVQTNVGTSIMIQRQTGDMADINVSFCPIVAVSKYPYRFMSQAGPANKLLVDQISLGLFANQKFWDRSWSV